MCTQEWCCSRSPSTLVSVDSADSLLTASGVASFHHNPQQEKKDDLFSSDTKWLCFMCVFSLSSPQKTLTTPKLNKSLPKVFGTTLQLFGLVPYTSCLFWIPVSSVFHIQSLLLSVSYLLCNMAIWRTWDYRLPCSISVNSTDSHN